MLFNISKANVDRFWMTCVYEKSLFTCIILPTYALLRLSIQSIIYRHYSGLWFIPLFLLLIIYHSCNLLKLLYFGRISNLLYSNIPESSNDLNKGRYYCIAITVWFTLFCWLSPSWASKCLGVNGWCFFIFIFIERQFSLGEGENKENLQDPFFPFLKVH